MKPLSKLITLIAFSSIIISCTHNATDDMLGNYKGMMKGTLLWSKTNVGIPDASIDSKDERIIAIKKNDKGEFYMENGKGIDITLQNVNSISEGVTFTIPQQKVQGQGDDSTSKSELHGLMEYTLAGTKCDGYFDRKNNALSLSFGGILIVKMDTAQMTVPFTSAYAAIVKQKEEAK